MDCSYISASKPSSTTANCILGSPDSVNLHFSKISYDANVSSIELFKDTCNIPINRLADSDLVSSYASQDTLIKSVTNVQVVERMLSSFKKTAAGLDNIPYWFFKKCSFEVAEIVSHIIHCSLSTGEVPAQWQTAVITPIPKIPHATDITVYRPISVTPVLSRAVEKIVVNKFIRPALPKDLFCDQFAFRPTGSTTSALVYLMHHVTRMLESNAYIRCLLIDFSKAFDVISHSILLTKLKQFNLPSNIFNWIVSFLCNRWQVAKVDGRLSCQAAINKGVVQGSGIGPLLYSIMASDLKTMSTINELFKYADDTTLMSPEHTDVDLATEFSAICAWARSNEMTINMSKTKELVFHRPNPRHFIYPTPLDNIERVTECKLLGVFITDKLKFDCHVKFILSQCSQRVYALKVLRGQGLSRDCLSVIFQACIISRILYALPAWGGFLSQDLIGQINSFLRRMHRYGLCDKLLDLNDLLLTADRKLFQKVCLFDHCIHRLLPDVRANVGHLRPRGHPFVLPSSCSTLARNDFINRCLFNFV